MIIGSFGSDCQQYGTLANLRYDGGYGSSMSGSRFVSIADAGVDDYVEDVGGEVYEDVGESYGEDAAL